MILPIFQYGHPVLRKVGVDIAADYEGLRELIDNMYATMYKADGIGLAAPQVGHAIRLFVIDATPMGEDYPEVADFKRTFINAHILDYGPDTIETSEGCLSLPGISEPVRRSTSIRMRYMDENFVEHEETFSGYQAVVVQHEYDHTDGKMFIDHLGLLRRKLIRGKLSAISKGTAKVRYRVQLP